MYIAPSLFLGETGYLRLKELNARKSALSNEVESLKLEKERMTASLKTYRENDFYLEKRAREDFGLTKPDEYIFFYDR